MRLIACLGTPPLAPPADENNADLADSWHSCSARQFIVDLGCNGTLLLLMEGRSRHFN